MAGPYFNFLFILTAFCSGSRVHKCSLSNHKRFCPDTKMLYVYDDTIRECSLQNVCPDTPITFSSFNDCKAHCIKSNIPAQCLLPKVPGPCLNSFHNFYYNSTLRACEEFVYSGCEGNANNFETLDECKKTCNVSSQVAIQPPNISSGTEDGNNHLIYTLTATSVSSESRAHKSTINAMVDEKKPSYCSLPSSKGNCDEAMNRFFHDPTDGHCKAFIYSGCGGNLNRFSTIEDCETTCTNPCTTPVYTVSCFESQPIRNFYYDRTVDACVQFETGICGGSSNNFQSKVQCEKKCVKNVCELRPLPVLCEDEVKRIYYDPKTQTCRHFYDACLGDGNSFATVQDCEKKCVIKAQTCHLAKDQGHPCRYFYYDVTSKQCQSYSAGKCAGTINSFLTYRQCTWMCEVNACIQETALSNCDSSVSRHFYNLTTRECERMPRGKCSSSINDFESKDYCQAECFFKDICKIQVSQGTCNGSESRWYFKSESGRCEKFSYSGCGGNANNFLSEAICEKACFRNRCHLPKGPVPCRTPQHNYSYDLESGICFFSNITCLRSGDRFSTLEQCEQTCIVDNPCRAPVEETSCEMAFTRYFYDSLKGECTSFEYAGCGGNANNYESLEECNAACQDKEENLTLPKSVNINKPIGILSNVGGRGSSILVDGYKILPESHAVNTTSDVGKISFGGSIHTGTPENRPHQKPQIIDNESTLSGKVKHKKNSSLENDEPTSEVHGDADRIEPEIGGDRCILPLWIGSCNTFLKRFYFDPITHTCQQFIYSGCEGNANNFLTMKGCMKACVDICYAPVEMGQCKVKVNRYRYNMSSGMCEQIPVSKCSNSLNNFQELDTCEKICVRDVCLQRKKTGPCRSHIERYFYDPTTDHCFPFIYGGCRQNGNNFLSREECQRQCFHLNHCLLLPDANICATSSEATRFQFNAISGECEATDKIPCDSRANNFKSLQECESRCKLSNPCVPPAKTETSCNEASKFARFFYNRIEGICEKHFVCTASGFETFSSCKAKCLVNVCTLPGEHGPCDLDRVRYYYSQENKKCRPFLYGGCYGNNNNFETIDECASRCDPDRCSRPKKVGFCDKHFKRYFYNSKISSCLPFDYSGCGGNSNNFPTLESCQNACGIQKCSPSPDKEKAHTACKSKPEMKDCAYTTQKHRFYYNSSVGLCMNFETGKCGSDIGNSFSSLGECEKACNRDVCKLPPLSSHCDVTNNGRFFYDESADACTSFDEGICGANKNSFTDVQQCENRCVKDICHFTKDGGPCMAIIERVFYNRLSGECEQFHYGGCGGNKNNFDSKQHCEKQCMKDPCKLPYDSGTGDASMPKYYYDSKNGQCRSFLYSGCGGNPNRFDTIEACLQKCQPNSCNLPPDAGPCLASFHRFYYDSSHGKCNNFIYGGCRGNGNHFETIKQCEETCQKDPCVQPVKVGPCEAIIKRFYFNSMTGECERFYYGGCDGNENNFRTIEECQKRCACSLPPKIATCHNHKLTHFYFDMATGRCHNFIHNGCSGNANGFLSIKQCAQVCIQNRCEKQMDPGSCDKNLARFFYDSKKRKCVSFLYGGCRGNTNNFQSEQLCKHACLSEDPCLQPKMPGSCDEMHRRFYYDSIEGKCLRFLYGGCLGNRNNFHTLSECQHKCKRNANKCLLHKEEGLCSSSEERFYYNPILKSCERFNYTGCAGNANNFLSKSQCEQECKFDLCKQSTIVGSCSRNEEDVRGLTNL